MAKSTCRVLLKVGQPEEFLWKRFKLLFWRSIFGAKVCTLLACGWLKTQIGGNDVEWLRRALSVDCRYGTWQQDVQELVGRGSPNSRLAALTSAHGLSSSLSASEGSSLASWRPVSRSMSDRTAGTASRPLQGAPSTGAHYLNLDRWNTSIAHFDEYSWWVTCNLVSKHWFIPSVPLPW